MNEEWNRIIEQSYLFAVVGECMMPFTDLITDEPAKRRWFYIGNPRLCSYSAVEYFFVQDFLSTVSLC